MGCDEAKPVVEAEAAEKRRKLQEQKEKEEIEEQLRNKKRKSEENNVQEQSEANTVFFVFIISTGSFSLSGITNNACLWNSSA